MGDRELLERIAGGDERALEELISRYESRLAGYLRSLLSDHAAAEAVLWETVTEVWKGAARFRGECEPWYWILSIARNRAFRHLRKNKRHQGEPLDPRWSGGGASPERVCRWREVAREVCGLDPKHRDVLILSYWLGMNSSEISEMTGLPAATVRTRRHYAREKLRKRL